MLPAPLKRFFTTPGRKFAVLVVLGMLIVAAPLAEVLHRLGVDLQATSAARQALAPLTLAVQAQRALLAHQPVAGAVLAGREDREAERLQRQHAVDMGLAQLAASLHAQQLVRALDEFHQLRHDWWALLQGIGARRLPTAASDTAHELLVEQTFVIVDLVTATQGLQAQAGRAFDAGLPGMALHTLPRFSAALAKRRQAGAAAASADAATARPRMAPGTIGAEPLRAQAGQIARHSAQWLHTAQRSAAAVDPALAGAFMTLQQCAGELAQGDATIENTAGALLRAEQATQGAIDAVMTHLDHALADAEATLHRERMIAALSLATALLLGALAAALALPRSRTGAGAAGPVAPTVPLPLHAAAAPTGAESEQPTSDLLQRLRRHDAQATRPPSQEPQP